MSDLTDIQSLGDEELVDAMDAWETLAETGDHSIRSKVKAEILRRTRGPEWVSVEEGLPEKEDGRYLTVTANEGHWYDNDPTPYVRRFNGERFVVGGAGNAQVTHWRELPTPPSERDE